MKKIPTIFKRDFANRGKITEEWNPDCLWVRDGEGIATRKWDGTSCLYKDGLLYKRRELRPGDETPKYFVLADHDEETGKTFGWVPVRADSPEDQWHREAFEIQNAEFPDGLINGGTCELIGPKVNGGKDGTKTHGLVQHGNTSYQDAPRTFAGLKEWLAGQQIEGLVWHHPDGRMAKIKRRDFGLKW